LFLRRCFRALDMIYPKEYKYSKSQAHEYHIFSGTIIHVISTTGTTTKSTLSF
ncbi:MAG: hypothetical protein ACI8RD_001427, partial [Bacillariaceae sp.]